jgi:murein DD-endopeptidase MepM/ murein hydrolase activator NlpD
MEDLMPDVRALVRAARGRRFAAVLAGLTLFAATHLIVTSFQERDALQREVRWLQGRLAEKRGVIARQRDDLAQVASGVEQLVRTTATVRDRALQARALAEMEERRDAAAPEPHTMQVMSDGDFTPVSENAARTLQHLAWLDTQTAVVGDSVGLLTALLRAAPDVSERHGIPSLWPVRGAITSRFGKRRSPYDEEQIEMHPGLDIKARHGQPVTAGGDGKVVFAGRDAGYGRLVIVEHSGDIDTFYAHLSAIAVREGDFVRRGQIVGAVGSTGRSTGAHLHYEVRVSGRPVDPRRYLVN